MLARHEVLARRAGSTRWRIGSISQPLARQLRLLCSRRQVVVARVGPDRCKALRWGLKGLLLVSAVSVTLSCAEDEGVGSGQGEPDATTQLDGGDGGWPGVKEVCDNGLDDDSNGEVDEGCPCDVGTMQDCYPLPNEPVKNCAKGTQTCKGLVEFANWGQCVGAVVPVAGASECCSTDGFCLAKYPGCGDLIQVFPQSGTWKKPSVGTMVTISCWGAGGGGGKGNNQNPDHSAGGGGGGGFDSIMLSLDALGDTVAVTIGPGGIGGDPAKDGTDGGESSFGAHLTVGGGKGGIGNGGPGGLGGTGDVAGSKGQDGVPGSNSDGGKGGDAAKASVGLACGLGGLGGDNGVADGKDGEPPGGGGGGGAARGGSLAGGDGASGFCIAVVS